MKPTRQRARSMTYRQYPLHLMLLPGVVLTLVYAYGPMFGVTMAFQEFNPALSFWGSPFIGLGNFDYVFGMPTFGQIIRNTLVLAFLKIVSGLSVPLVLALLINEVRHNGFKRGVQTSFFLPFFLSWAVLGGIFREVFALDGLVNEWIVPLFRDEPVFFMANNSWFPAILVVTDTWKGMGYNIIIYLAAITSIDPTLYEAAVVDGCGRIRRMIHITLPGMLPIIILLATLAIGQLLNAGFEQIFMLYNPMVYESADIIDTFVYRLGLINGQLAPAAAVGLFKSGVSLVLVGAAYFLAYRYSNYRIF